MIFKFLRGWSICEVEQEDILLCVHLRLAVCLVLPLAAFSQPVDERVVIAVPHTVHAKVNPGSERGRVEPSRIIHEACLTLGLSAAQQKALDALLQEQRDPLSPNYRNWLTPEEFGSAWSESRGDG